jgi:RNA polymerase sigma-70 factor, ECF subfamily
MEISAQAAPLLPASAAEGDPADARLMERIARGDREAFDALVARHEGALFRFAGRLVGDEAEDALQEALLSLWRSAGSWRGEASVRTWLFQVVAHACHRRLRRAPEGGVGVDDERSAEVASGSPAPDAVASARQVGRALEAALARLEPEAREVLLLRDVEELPGEEVAAVLGLSLAAMKSRLHRGRLALKEQVEAILGRPISEELP